MKQIMGKCLLIFTTAVVSLMGTISCADKQITSAKKIRTLPQAGIDNEHILISIICLIIITGAFFIFFKKKENKQQ